jgi:glycine betaine/proline transport system ATP-binding protein
MEDAGISSIFVIDKDNIFRGLLTIDDAIKAYKSNLSIEELLIRDIHKVAPDTPLKDLFGVAVEAKYPLAVIEHDKLLGIVTRVSILSGLGLGRDEVPTI